jgi:hypothetical protein
MDKDFDQFWNQYPRKVARAHAYKMWQRLNSEEKFAALHALPVHVRYWAAAGRDMDRIPHAGSWLNPDEGRRWEDELEMPAPKDEMGEWWKTTSGIHRKALSLGMTAKPGEDWHELKARILAKEKAA